MVGQVCEDGGARLQPGGPAQHVRAAVHGRGQVVRQWASLCELSQPDRLSFDLLSTYLLRYDMPEIMQLQEGCL